MSPRTIMHLAALSGALAVVAAPAARADDVAHLCGGIGKDGRAEMRTHIKDYNLGFVLAEGADRRYLAAVPIEVRQGDKSVAHFVSDGPVCYLKLPEGSYTIVGTHRDVVRSLDVHTGKMDAQLNW